MNSHASYVGASKIEAGSTMTPIAALLASESYSEICQYLHEHIASEDLVKNFLVHVLATIESSPRAHRTHPVGQTILKKMIQNSNMLFLVSEIMQRHPGKQRIQEYGCTFIDYAFRTRFDSVRTDDITPCATAVVIAIQSHSEVSRVQYVACRALEALLLTEMTDGKYPFLHTPGQYLVVNLVHKAMFKPQMPEFKEKMYEACCLVLASLVPGWKYKQSVGDGKSVAFEGEGDDSNHGIDRAIAAAMSAFPENNHISLYGSCALGWMAEEYLDLFVDMEKNIINVANAFLMDYTDGDFQQAAAGALLNFIHNKATGKTNALNQKKIGLTGIIPLTVCALRNHYESNCKKGDITKIMCTLLDLLYALALDCIENQERILFTQTPALLLGIAKMHRRSSDTHMETTTLRLLCILRLNANQDRVIDPMWSYDLATWNVKIKTVAGSNLLEMIVPAIMKKNADSLLILDGLRLLGDCVDDLSRESRSEATNASVLTATMLLMTSHPPCSDEVTRLGVILLEKLSHHATFAVNPDMMHALSVPISVSLREDAQHCSTRNRAIQQVAAHMTA